MKERQISARQLDYGDMRLGLRAEISSRAGSRLPMCVQLRSCRLWEMKKMVLKEG